MLSSQTVRSFTYYKGKTAKLYSLPALEEAGIAKISRLPVSIRIVLESVLRNCDGKKISEQDVKRSRAGGDTVRGRSDCASRFHGCAFAGGSGGDA
jgi:aconitase A